MDFHCRYYLIFFFYPKFEHCVSYVSNVLKAIFFFFLQIEMQLMTEVCVQWGYGVPDDECYCCALMCAFMPCRSLNNVSCWGLGW